MFAYKKKSTYFNNCSKFGLIYKAISILVIYFKRPSQLVLQISPEDQVKSCYKLQKVNSIVLSEHKMFLITKQTDDIL